MIQLIILSIILCKRSGFGSLAQDGKDDLFSLLLQSKETGLRERTGNQLISEADATLRSLESIIQVVEQFSLRIFLFLKRLLSCVKLFRHLILRNEGIHLWVSAIAISFSVWFLLLNTFDTIGFTCSLIYIL